MQTAESWSPVQKHPVYAVGTRGLCDVPYAECTDPDVRSTCGNQGNHNDILSWEYLRSQVR